MKRIFAFVFGLIVINGFSQDHENLSSFNMTSLTYKFAPKWMLYAEIQARGIEEYTYIDYYEVKGGVGYEFAKNHQAFIGVGRYGTYQDHKLSQEELRLWLQYTFTQRFGALKVDHRLRAEQRFYHHPLTDTNSNTQRYRYRLSGTLPLNNKKVQAKTVFVNAFQEFFVGPKEPTFKRNRTFAGVGYQFNNAFSATTGYMFQREFATSGNKNLHYLYFAFNFTIDQSKEEKDIQIPMAD